MTTRVFSGLKPTGHLQLGNYLAAIRPLIDLTANPGHDVIVSVADLHALTIEHDPGTVRDLTITTAATLLACGLDGRTRVFVQSSVPAHTELAYLLECTAAYGEMTRMVQFKEKSAGQGSARLSLLTYPTLMAADILAYGTALVPVGEDQRQHLELTRTLARRFNARYGEVFTVPDALTPVAAARIKDLRTPTVKMGKSGADGAGVLFLLDPPELIAAKVRRAVTDADPGLSFDPVARPGVANLATILGALTGVQPHEALQGVVGATALKSAVTDAVIDTVGPIQQRYTELMVDQAALRALLADNRDTLAPIAGATIQRAREAIGLVSIAEAGARSGRT